MDSEGIKPDAFPAKTKTASGTVNDIPTEVVSMSFSDKLLITITQGGRLTQWVFIIFFLSPLSLVNLLTFSHLNLLKLAAPPHNSLSNIFRPSYPPKTSTQQSTNRACGFFPHRSKSPSSPRPPPGSTLSCTSPPSLPRRSCPVRTSPRRRYSARGPRRWKRGDDCWQHRRPRC